MIHIIITAVSSLVRREAVVVLRVHSSLHASSTIEIAVRLYKRKVALNVYSSLLSCVL